MWGIHMIKIFVSSTFKDMDYERDILHDEIVPELNEYASQYGEQVELCDLRWGIDTTGYDEVEGSKKILSVCLDEIERCNPYMVVLLGNRYGWVPDKKYVSDIDLQAEYYDKSVTELEIQYGALARNNPNALFYFRELDGVIPPEYESEDTDSAGKLKRLKQRIKELFPNQTYTYQAHWTGSGLKFDAFKEKVLFDIKEKISDRLSQYKGLSLFDREQRQHWNYARQKFIQYGARPDLEKLVNNGLNSNHRILGIVGEPGMGKSKFISQIAYNYGGTGTIVIPVFCGITKNSSTVYGVIYYLNTFFETNFGYMPDIQERDSISVLNSYLFRFGFEKRRLLIFIDGADQLLQLGQDMVSAFRYIPSNIKLVLSYTPEYIPGRPIKQIMLKGMKESEKKNVIDKIRESVSNRLSDKVIQEILNQNRSNEPLYLSIVYNIMMMLGHSDFEQIRAIDKLDNGMAAINEYQIAYIRSLPQNVGAYLLSNIAMRINEDFIQLAIDYIALSFGGLRTSDIENLVSIYHENIKWSELDMSRFVKLAKPYILIREDGRYDFMHKSFRTEVREKCNRAEKLRIEMIEYFETLPLDDTVRVADTISIAEECENAEMICEYINKTIDAVYQKDEQVSESMYRTAQELFSQLNDIVLADDDSLMLQIVEYEIKNYENTDDFLRYLNQQVIKSRKMNAFSLKKINRFYQLLIKDVYDCFGLEGSTLFFRNNMRIIYYIYRLLGVFSYKEIWHKDMFIETGIRSISISYMVLARCYLNYCKNKKELWQGIYYAELALSLFEKLGEKNSFLYETGIAVMYSEKTNKAYIAELYDILGNLYMKVEDYRNAENLIKKAVIENFDKIKNGLNDNEDIYHRLYENYVSMCKLMLQHDQPDFDRIIKIGLKAKEIYINHLSNYYDLFRSYFVIVKAYEEKGELEQAGRTAADNVNYCVKLSTDIPSLNNYMILMRAYGNLAQIYKRLNDNGSLTEQIIELKEKISNINQWINNNYEGADFSYEF